MNEVTVFKADPNIFIHFDNGGDPLALRAMIQSLHADMLAAKERGELDEVIPETSHTFSNGVYAREMRVKAGTLVLGKIHKTAHLNFLMHGTMNVLTEQGAATFTAPCWFESPPMTQKVGYAFTDATWLNIHRTDATTVEEAENELFSDQYTDFIDVQQIF